MRNLRVIITALVLSLLIASCSKHYDVGNVNGINAEGEVLLPVAHKSFTVRSLMERFQMDDAIVWTDEGNMTFCFYLENNGVVKGDEMLQFDDLHYTGHFEMENPYQHNQMPNEDTFVTLVHSVVFEADNIHVMRAIMKSGRLDFTVESNVGLLNKVVLRSSDITDEEGNSFEIELPVEDSTFSFDLEGLHYATDSANRLNLSYDLFFNVPNISEPRLSVDVNISGYDLALSEMLGFVDRFDKRSHIDSVFTLFPNNLGGTLDLNGVSIRVSECNTFNLGACLVVDTAMVYSEGLEPYSVLSPLPLSVDLPQQQEFGEVFNQTVSGQLNIVGGRAYSASDFIMNCENHSGLVTVLDSDRIDTRIDVEIPFVFSVDDVTYLDTVNLNLQHLDLPDLIEELTLDMEFVSTLPMGINASFFMYDSQADRITDTLLLNADLIEASLDGQPVTTKLTLVIDEDRVSHVMHSNRIIMSYHLDSNAHDVSLNVNQKLDLTLKARALYKGDVELVEEERL